MYFCCCSLVAVAVAILVDYLAILVDYLKWGLWDLFRWSWCRNVETWAVLKQCSEFRVCTLIWCIFWYIQLHDVPKPFFSYCWLVRAWPRNAISIVMICPWCYFPHAATWAAAVSPSWMNACTHSHMFVCMFTHVRTFIIICTHILVYIRKYAYAFALKWISFYATCVGEWMHLYILTYVCNLIRMVTKMQGCCQRAVQWSSGYTFVSPPLSPPSSILPSIHTPSSNFCAHHRPPAAAHVHKLPQTPITPTTLRTCTHHLITLRADTTIVHTTPSTPPSVCALAPCRHAHTSTHPPPSILTPYIYFLCAYKREYVRSLPCSNAYTQSCMHTYTHTLPCFSVHTMAIALVLKCLLLLYCCLSIMALSFNFIGPCKCSVLCAQCPLLLLSFNCSLLCAQLLVDIMMLLSFRPSWPCLFQFQWPSLVNALCSVLNCPLLLLSFNCSV